MERAGVVPWSSQECRIYRGILTGAPDRPPSQLGASHSSLGLRGLGQGRRSAGTGWHGHLVVASCCPARFPCGFSGHPSPFLGPLGLPRHPETGDLHLARHLPPAPCRLCLGCHSRREVGTEWAAGAPKLELTRARSWDFGGSWSGHSSQCAHLHFPDASSCVLEGAKSE